MTPRTSVWAVAVLALAVPAMALADAARQLAALEAQCAKDREAMIKPLREAQIAKCKADKANDPEHRERFWSQSEAQQLRRLTGRHPLQPTGQVTQKKADSLEPPSQG